MVCFLFKIGYKGVNSKLKDSINNLRNLIDDLTEKNKNDEKVLSELKIEITNAHNNSTDLKIRTENEAEKIRNESVILIEKMIKEKQAEYQIEVNRIERGLIAKLYHKYVMIIKDNIQKEFQAKADDKMFQNTSIEKAIQLLKSFKFL
ncbi:MAG: hypothetical protein LBF70_00890 [Holosporales bacterium]|jgi:1,4-alpha-glucan branching enzyme|nr:hypothetical protein [Holosporales bacterium]